MGVVSPSSTCKQLDQNQYIGDRDSTVFSGHFSIFLILGVGVKRSLKEDIAKVIHIAYCRSLCSTSEESTRIIKTYWLLMLAWKFFTIPFVGIIQEIKLHEKKCRIYPISCSKACASSKLRTDYFVYTTPGTCARYSPISPVSPSPF